MDLGDALASVGSTVPSLAQQVCVSLVVSLTVGLVVAYVYGVYAARSYSDGSINIPARQPKFPQELCSAANEARVWLRQPSSSKSACWLDVRAYGAIGDGAADDTAAIVAAINAAAYYDPKVGDFGCGNTVLFPPGIYIISKTVQLPNRVALQGANGRGVSTLFRSPTRFLTQRQLIGPRGAGHDPCQPKGLHWELHVPCV